MTIISSILFVLYWSTRTLGHPIAVEARITVILDMTEQLQQWCRYTPQVPCPVSAVVHAYWVWDSAFPRVRHEDIFHLHQVAL